jgi:hypothetical protein
MAQTTISGLFDDARRAASALVHLKVITKPRFTAWSAIVDRNVCRAARVALYANHRSKAGAARWRR